MCGRQRAKRDIYVQRSHTLTKMNDDDDDVDDVVDDDDGGGKKLRPIR